MLTVAMVLGACSQPADTAQADRADAERSATPPDRNAAAPARSPQATQGDGSNIRLAPLSIADIRNARLEGELACGFTGPQGQVLLHAAGNVASSDRAVGLVKVAGAVESVSAAGGFNGMVRGATFTGTGKTTRVRVTGDTPAAGQESPAYAASLTVEPADGGRQTIDGTWTCGP